LNGERQYVSVPNFLFTAIIARIKMRAIDHQSLGFAMDWVPLVFFATMAVAGASVLVAFWAVVRDWTRN
jgi:hypothetical protein